MRAEPTQDATSWAQQGETRGSSRTGGDVQKGYLAAKETLSDKLCLFDNELNIFVAGLGGGTSGMLGYILEQINKSNSYQKNILIATYPADEEANRKIKADELLRKIEPLIQKLLLIKLDKSQVATSTYQELFENVDKTIAELLRKAHSMTYKQIIDYFDKQVNETVKALWRLLD